MKLPFSKDNFRMVIDGATGGDKVYKIALEDIKCSLTTGSGLLETLAGL